MSTFRTTFQILGHFWVRDTRSVSPSESVAGLGQEIKDGWSYQPQPLTAEAWKASACCGVAVCHCAPKQHVLGRQEAFLCSSPEGPSCLAAFFCCNSRLGCRTKGSVQTVARDTHQPWFLPSYHPEPEGKVWTQPARTGLLLQSATIGFLTTHRKRGSQHSLRATVDTPPHSLHTPTVLCV